MLNINDAVADQAVREISDCVGNYNELLFAVVRAFPDETRHETALRYIREAEEKWANQGPACQSQSNTLTA